MSASLGIDVGLSGVRACVMRDDGSVAATSREPLPPIIREGVVEQDPNAWVPAIIDAGSRAIEAGAIRVDGVGVAALGPAPILIGADGRALGPTPLFGLDRRADAWRSELGTGPDHALPTLLRWSSEAPELFGSARAVLDAAGFVVRSLTGLDAMDRITAEAYRAVGVETPVTLPPVTEPDAIAGGVGREAAARLGLAEGTPVSVGTIDCFADLGAAGVARPGEGAVLLGSTLILYVVTEEGASPQGLETSSHLGTDPLVGGSTATAGLALDWLAGIDGIEEGDRQVAGSLEPGAGGLLALPYLAGERVPLNDPLARGGVIGLTLATSRAQLYRAFVDGIAVTALDIADRLDEAGLAPGLYRVAGGGVRDPVWLAATCDALGRPLEVMPDTGTAVGAAWLGLRMLGDAPERTPERVVEPDPDRHERFRTLLDRARAFWRAAGPTVRLLDGGGERTDTGTDDSG